MPADMTAAHIAGQAGAFEPQRGNNALLRIFGVPGDVIGPKGESILTLSLNGFGLPNITVEALETFFLNERRKIAGTVTFEDMEAVYKDFVDMPTASILKTWHEQVYNPVTGNVGLARNYKKTGLIELFGPNNTFRRFWFVQGVWPSVFNAGAIDMASAEPVLVTMTLTYDKCYAAKTPAIANLIGSL